MSALIQGMGDAKKIWGADPFPHRSQDGQDGNVGGIEDSVFGSIFKSAIQNVRDTDAELTEAQYLVSTGQLDNPVQLGIAAYKNEIAVQLLIQMRNKALEAYNELKNMSV